MENNLNNEEYFNINFEKIFKDLELNEERDDIPTGALDNPSILICLVVDSVQNFHRVSFELRTEYRESFNRIEDLIKDRFYDSLWTYMEKVPNNNYFVLERLLSYNKKYVIYSLKELLENFEKRELFERCMHIFKLLQNFERNHEFLLHVRKILSEDDSDKK